MASSSSITSSSSRTREQTLYELLKQDLNLNIDYNQLADGYAQYNDTVSAELIKNINSNL